MYEKVERTKENTVGNFTSFTGHKKNACKQNFRFIDNRNKGVAQRNVHIVQSNYSEYLNASNLPIQCEMEEPYEVTKRSDFTDEEKGTSSNLDDLTDCVDNHLKANEQVQREMNLFNAIKQLGQQFIEWQKENQLVLQSLFPRLKIIKKCKADLLIELSKAKESTRDKSLAEERRKKIPGLEKRLEDLAEEESKIYNSVEFKKEAENYITGDLTRTEIFKLSDLLGINESFKPLIYLNKERSIQVLRMYWDLEKQPEFDEFNSIIKLEQSKLECLKRWHDHMPEVSFSTFVRYLDTIGEATEDNILLFRIVRDNNMYEYFNTIKEIKKCSGINLVLFSKSDLKALVDIHSGKNWKRFLEARKYISDIPTLIELSNTIIVIKDILPIAGILDVHLIKAMKGFQMTNVVVDSAHFAAVKLLAAFDSNRMQETNINIYNEVPYWNKKFDIGAVTRDTTVLIAVTTPYGIVYVHGHWIDKDKRFGHFHATKTQEYIEGTTDDPKNSYNFNLTDKIKEIGSLLEKTLITTWLAQHKRKKYTRQKNGTAIEDIN